MIVGRQTAIAACVFVALGSFPVMASNIAYDVTGSQSNGALGNPSNTVDLFNLAAALGLPSGTSVTVDAIGWDVTITANDPSWLSETTVNVNNSTNNSAAAFNVNPGASVNASGTMPFISMLVPVVPDLLLSDGVARLEFFETFNDSAVDPDAIWDSGDLIFSTVEDAAAPAPEPSTLFGFVAAGFGGVFFGRLRSRRARAAMDTNPERTDDLPVT